MKSTTTIIDRTYETAYGERYYTRSIYRAWNSSRYLRHVGKKQLSKKNKRP